jgi:hypothetical protein
MSLAFLMWGCWHDPMPMDWVGQQILWLGVGEVGGGGTFGGVGVSCQGLAVIDDSTSTSWNQCASSIWDAIRGIAENSDALSLENIRLGLSALSSVAASLMAIRKMSKEWGEEGAKRAAEKTARVWAQADGSLIAYAGLRGMGLESALVSATNDINRFVSRSHPGAQAIEIALKMPKEERLAVAMGFEAALEDFAGVMPRDAGIAQNHVTLARLASSPWEAVAAGERAAVGALQRGDAVTARGREACFTLLKASAARAVAIERGEWAQEMVKPNGVVAGQPESVASDSKRGRLRCNKIVLSR